VTHEPQRRTEQGQLRQRRETHAGSQGRVVLPAEARAIAEARRRVAAALEANAVPEAKRASALLLVSELVTNGIKHGSREGDEIELSWRLEPDAVHIAVRDAARSATPPRRLRASSGHTTGRGLRIVEELADAWNERMTEGRREIAFRLRI
jgi:serine/threonine-protein kinase RsbW